MEHPIGALPRTPFPASRDFPSRGNERYEGKNSESYTAGTISAFPPFGGWCHHLSPTSWGHYKASLCCELLMKGLLFGALLSHRSAGGRWCRKAPKGGKPPEVADYRSAYYAI